MLVRAYNGALEAGDEGLRALYDVKGQKIKEIPTKLQDVNNLNGSQLVIFYV